MDFKSERGKGIARMDWEEGERTKNRKNYWKGPKYVLKKKWESVYTLIPHPSYC